MRLRHRLALTFAGATSFTLASALTMTFAVFKHAQDKQLDYALFARAQLEIEETSHKGGEQLYIEQEPTGQRTGLESLVKYGAAYGNDGAIIDSTPTFQDDPPALRKLGWHQGVAPARGIDFVHHGHSLRGVILPVGPAKSQRIRYLLLAVPIGEAEADTRHLLQIMAAVLVVAVGASLLIGWWVGGRMSRGIEHMAEVARRVSQGELKARAHPRKLMADEVRSLGHDLNHMIARLGALIDAERRFVSHAAHELRSPLTTLRGELELALRRRRSEDDYRAAIEESLESTNRLVGLSEDLLTFARAGATAHVDPVAQQTLVGDVINGAVRDSMVRSERHRRVEIRGDTDWLVYGGCSDLTRLVRNLIDNALEHAPEDTPVRVFAREAGVERIEIVVEDDGPGVPAAVRERLFEAFVRGDRERQRSGAGLGLAIAREIAVSWGGALVLDSPSTPTRFVVRLRRASGLGTCDTNAQDVPS